MGPAAWVEGWVVGGWLVLGASCSVGAVEAGAWVGASTRRAPLGAQTCT
jgi:hypothetical protein